MSVPNENNEFSFGKKLSLYYDKVSLSVAALTIGAFGLQYGFPKTVGEALPWLGGILILGGLIGLGRGLSHVYKEVEDAKPHATAETATGAVEAHNRFQPSTKSILKMCWGLTMNISHEQPQRELGTKFTEKFFSIFDEKEEHSSDSPFTQNLLFALSGTIRSIAFVRENHVTYLNYQADRLMCMVPLTVQVRTSPPIGPSSPNKSSSRNPSTLGQYAGNMSG